MAAAGALLAAAAAPAATPPSAAQNRAAAESDAASLVAAAQLPPGAERLEREPPGDHGTLTSLPFPATNPYAAIRTAWYRVAQPAADALAFIDAHVPAGMGLRLSGSGETRDGQSATYRAFERPRLRHRLATRWLVLSIATLADGATGIRLDGYVSWLKPRPAGLTLRGARDLTITSGKRKIRVTYSPWVQRIQRMFNALDVQQPAPLSCPNQPKSPPQVRLAFRARAGGPALAYAHVRPTGCARADVVVGGKRYGALDLSNSDGRRLLDFLKELGA